MKVLRKGKDTEVNNNGNTGEQFYQYKENIHEKQATQVDIDDLAEEQKTVIQDQIRFNGR